MIKKIITVSAVAAFALTGCTNNSNVDKPSSEKYTLKFNEVSVPKTDKEKRAISTSSTIEIDGTKTKISYNTILRSGDKIGENTFGLLYDVNGNPIKGKDGEYKISNSNDFASLLPVKDKLFMVSHFESRPAAMYLTELKQEKDGKLTALSTKNIDFSEFNGLWVTCAGSVTPWGSHLGSEEYEPDAKKVQEDGSINPYYNAMGDYFGGDLKALNPYDYGWTPEVTVLNEKGDVEVQKHYTMGRFAHELAYVMPDKKTVYLSDDGTNVAIFMFIADKEGDLSSGTLYAAKWEQRSAKGAGRADIKWVNLGHSTDEYIKAGLDLKLKFEDIFEVSKEKKEGFTSVNTTMGEEYLKVKPNMQQFASRMEARRYAATLGATTEFRKMEGITYNSNNNILYISMSSIEKGMEDGAKKGKYDNGGNNDIRLAKNKCGAVYGLNLASFSTQSATDGSKINSKYVANSMYELVAGVPTKGDDANTCSVEGLANPDNITYINNTNTLIIGEDTGSGHQNDYIWSYNLGSKKLTRILTSPYGSETTSPYYYNNIGGHGYLMAVIQHPYGEGDALTKEEDMPSKAQNSNQMRAYTGYVGPLPVITK